MRNVDREKIEGFLKLLGGAGIAADAVIGAVQVRELAKGEVFQRAGAAADEVAFVLSGILRVYYLTADGRMFVRAFAAEGAPAAAYSAALAGNLSDVTIDALEDARVAVIRIDELVKLYDDDRAWQRFGRKLAERFYALRERREYEFLALDATARLAAFETEHGAIQARLTQVNVAAYLGITPVSLSRLKAKLTKP